MQWWSESVCDDESERLAEAKYRRMLHCRGILPLYIQSEGFETRAWLTVAKDTSRDSETKNAGKKKFRSKKITDDHPYPVMLEPKTN